MKKYFIALFAFVLCFGLFSTDVKAADKDTIENGVYIGDIDVSGMSIIEAKQAVLDYVEAAGEKEITLNAMNNNQVDVSLGSLSIKWANEEIVEEAAALGKEGNIVQRYKALKDLAHENKVYEIKYEIDKTKLQEVITTDCEPFNVEAEDATLERVDDNFVVKPGTTGVLIDVEGSVDAVYNYITTEWNGEDAAVDLVVTVDEPRGTEEELSKVKDVLGTFTTSYKTSGASRSGNVSNGTSLVNGTLLYPGDSFSMYETVSPFTEANGYFMAGSYLNGLVVDSLGGGICQVSTTLYNAVLKAELDVTERFNHSMIVNYVDPSADAAIAGTTKDFKFVNNLEHPIYIEGYTENKHITFTIYGVETRPADREVIYESKIISETIPEGDKVVADGSQPIGVVNVQSPHTGYVAELWKVVKEGGVEVERKQVNKSVYKATQRTAAVGIASPDPNAVAAINAAIATQSIDHVRNVAAALSDPAQAAALAAQQQALAAQQAAIAQQQAAMAQQQEAIDGQQDAVAP